MMKQYAMGVGVALALTAGVGLLSLRADDRDIPTDTYKVADLVGTKDWAGLTKEGAAVAKKYDLDKIMYQFKLRKAPKNPGLGIGATPGVIKPDGIEAKLNNMAKSGVKITKTDLDNAEALTRMAQITAGVAAIVANVPNDKAKKTPAETQKWKDYAKEMHDASLDLIKGLKSKDAKQIKAASLTLQGSCTKCHADFRE